MSDITAAGRKVVTDEMITAESKLLKARIDYESRLEQYEILVKANACPHDNIKDRGAFMYAQTQCDDCGFMWTDT